MMNSMNTSGFSSISLVLLHLHWFFGAFAIIGLILLTVFAIRSLRKEQLKTLTIWLLVVGIAGSLLTAPFSPLGLWHRGGGKTHHMMMNKGNMQQMMQMMMGHNEGTTGKDHDEHVQMQEMINR
jgi:hypothetical protein